MFVVPNYLMHRFVAMEMAAQLMSQRPELAKLLITHRLPLADAAQGFEIAGNRKEGAIKVVLEP